MVKHLTSIEDNGVDIGKNFKEQTTGLAIAETGSGRISWQNLLGSALEREILPRLLKAVRAPAGFEPISANRLDDATVAAFVALLIDDDVEQLRAVADRVILHTGGRGTLLAELLTPAARLLGQMWEADTCDFMTVTLGVYRLNQIMRETESVSLESPLAQSYDRRILLLPAPGDQHSFGVTMVADAFRGCGWCVRSAPSVSRKQLLRLVKDEWFDVVGLSVSTERCLKGLSACIRAVRAASCNPRTVIMLGGNAIICNPERSRFLGADGIAEDAGKAVQMADNFVENTVTERFEQFNTMQSDVSRAL